MTNELFNDERVVAKRAKESDERGRVKVTQGLDPSAPSASIDPGGAGGLRVDGGGDCVFWLSLVGPNLPHRYKFCSRSHPNADRIYQERS